MSRVITRFGADTTGFKQGVAELQNRVSRFSTQVRGYMFKAFAAGAVLAQLRSITRELDRIDKLSRRFGVDTGFLQDLAQQADLSGASMEQAARSLSQLVREINRVEGPSQRVAIAIEAMGYTVEELRKLRADELFSVIAEKVGGLASENEALTIATGLMGRSAEELLPLLQDIYETGGLAEASRHTDEAIRSAVDFKDSMTSLGRTLSTVVSPILVVVSSLLAAWLDILQTFRRVVNEVNKAAARSFMLLGRAIIAALTLDRDALRQVAADYKNVFKEAFEEIKNDAKETADEAIRQGKRIANALGANFDTGRETGQQPRERTGVLSEEALERLERERRERERQRQLQRELQNLGREETGVLQNLDRLRSALASPNAAGVGSLQRVGGGGVFNAPQADPNIKLQNEQLAELARIREAIESVQKEVE